MTVAPAERQLTTSAGVEGVEGVEGVVVEVVVSVLVGVGVVVGVGVGVVEGTSETDTLEPVPTTSICFPPLITKTMLKI